MGKKLRSETQSPGGSIPLPRELSAGCGLAWRMPPEEWQLWQSRIDPLPMMPQRW